MKKINAIDLDKTLIPFDSLNRYLVIFLLKKECMIPIVLLMIKRFIRLISNDMFKRSILKLTSKQANYNAIMKKFSTYLLKFINKEVLSIVENHSDINTINILTTASYKSYSQYIAEYQGWECLASFYDETTDEFIHNYKLNKIEILIKHYPSNKYFYNLAISDSKNDQELLNLFNTRIVYKK